MNTNKRITSLALATWFTLMGACAMAAPPAPAKAPPMKDVATCADGKVYRSASGEHRGACSGHGGVVAWADGSPVKSNKRKTEYR